MPKECAGNESVRAAASTDALEIRVNSPLNGRGGYMGDTSFEGRVGFSV